MERLGPDRAPAGRLDPADAPSGMDGMVRLVASLCGEVTRAEVVECRAPLALRITGEPGPVLHVSLLHTGAGYFAHDRTHVGIEVGEGAAVCLSTPGASIAFPSVEKGWSAAGTYVTVRRGGFLAYLPEPLIAAEGCSHTAATVIDLEEGAEALWREEICAGRTGETGGRVELTFSARIDRHPLFRDAILLGRDGSLGPRTLAGSKFTGTLARLGSRFPDLPGVMQLAGPGSVVRTVADDALSVRRNLNRYLASSAPGPMAQSLNFAGLTPSSSPLPASALP